MRSTFNLSPVTNFLNTEALAMNSSQYHRRCLQAFEAPHLESVSQLAWSNAEMFYHLEGFDHIEKVDFPLLLSPIRINALPAKVLERSAHRLLLPKAPDIGIMTEILSRVTSANSE